MTTVTTYTSSAYKEFVFDSLRTCEHCGSHFTAVYRAYVFAQRSASRSSGFLFTNKNAEHQAQVRTEGALLRSLKGIALEQPYLPHRCTNCGRYGSRDIDALREALANPDRTGVPIDKNASYGGATYGRGGVIGTGYPQSLRQRRISGIPQVILGVPLLSFMTSGIVLLLLLVPSLLSGKGPDGVTFNVVACTSIAITIIAVTWFCIKEWWPPSEKRLVQRLADCNGPQITGAWLEYWRRKTPQILSILHNSNTDDSQSSRAKRVRAWRRLIRCQRRLDP